MDIANLGITVNSAQLLTAADRLTKISASAAKAESELTGLSGGLNKTDKAVTGTSSKIDKAKKSMDDFSDAANIKSELDNLSSGLSTASKTLEDVVAKANAANKSMEQFSQTLDTNKGLLNVQNGLGQTENALSKVSQQADKAGQSLYSFTPEAAVQNRLYGLNDGINQTETSLSRVADRADGATKAFNGFKNILQVAGVSLAAKEIIGFADSWSDLNSRVRLAAGGVEESADVMKRLGEMAQRTYSPLEQTAETYLRNSTAMRELGYTTSETLDFVEAINNAFVASGIKGQQAESVMTALSKAMAAGKLSGDSLNTVVQSGGKVAEILANYLGVTTTQLARLGAEGKITGNVIKTALTGELENLRDAAESMPGTVGDGATLITNAFKIYVGTIDQSLGATEKASEAMKWLSENMDIVIKSIGGMTAIMAAKTFAPYIESATKGTISTIKQTAALLQGKSAAVQQSQALLQLAQAEQAQAKSALQAAQAEVVRANALKLSVAAQNGIMSSQYKQAVEAHTIAVTSAKNAENLFAVAAKNSDQQLVRTNATIKAATLSARALAGAATLAGRALSFVGGPIGAAMLALGGIMYFVSSKAAEAQVTSDKYAEAIRIAGERSHEASGGIKEAAKELFGLKKAATSAEQALNIDKSAEELKTITGNMRAAAALANGLYNTKEYGTNIGKFDDLFIELNRLILQFEKGEISAEQYNASISKVFDNNPSLTWLKDLIALLGTQSREADAARGSIEGYKAAIDSIDTFRIGRPIGLDEREILQGAATSNYVKDKLEYLSLSKEERKLQEEINRAKSEAAAQGLELNDEQAKSIALQTIASNATDNHKSSVEKGSKAYDDMAKSIERSNKELAIQAQTAGLTGVAADAYQIKLQLLNAAEEQFGKLTPNIVKDAEQKADAYKKIAEAAAKAQLNADLYSDRVRMGLSTVEQGVFDTFNQYGIPYGSDPQLAAAIRYNSVLEMGIGYAQSFANTLTSGLVNGTKFTESLGNAFKNLGNQILSMATNDIISGLFRNLLGGGGSGGGWLSSLFGGFMGGGFPAAPSGGLYANGGAFGTGTQRFAKGSAFTNSIVSSPTPFKFADGGGFSNGVMGEAGPEAILPLKRDAQGRLGVAQHGGGNNQGGGGTQTNVSVDVKASKYFDVIVGQRAQEVSQQQIKQFAQSPQLKQVAEQVTRGVLKTPSKRF